MCPSSLLDNRGVKKRPHLLARNIIMLITMYLLVSKLKHNKEIEQEKREKKDDFF